MKILLVLNPISGGVDKAPFLKKAQNLCEKYGIDYHVFKTTGKDDDKKMAAVLKSYKPSKIAACGGDGTVLFAAKALRKKKIPMGIVPLGSANGMATELGVNEDPLLAFTDVLLSQKITDLDLIKVNGEYCLHIGDCGINARLVKQFEADENRGMATYAKYFMKELARSETFEMTIETDKDKADFSGYMLAICNARKFGTGIPLNAKGNPLDGKFELVVIQSIDAGALISAGLAKFNDAFLSPKNAKVLQTKKASVTFKKPQLLQLDGEVIGECDALKIEILAGAISFITHTENQYL